MPDANRWKIDRHIPIALILTVLLQTVGAVWWTAKLESRIEVLELYVKTRSGDGERLIRIEERLNYIAEQIANSRKESRR